VLVLAAGAQAPGASVAGPVTDRGTGQPVPRMIVAAVGADRRAVAEAVADIEGRYGISVGRAPRDRSLRTRA